MNVRIMLSVVIATFLVCTSSYVMGYAHLGSTLPPLGNVSLAGQLVKEGNKLAAAGNVGQAVTLYQEALAASPFCEDAKVGLARCAAKDGNYAAAISDYQKVINNYHEQDYINYQTEYVLVLSKAGRYQEAIKAYNHVVNLCEKGFCIQNMDILPTTFLTNGSDYNPVELQAMTHVIRAMNSSDDDYDRMSSEMQKALALEPNSAFVNFYEGVILRDSKASGAKKAFEQAAALTTDPALEKAAEDELK